MLDSTWINDFVNRLLRNRNKERECILTKTVTSDQKVDIKGQVKREKDGNPSKYVEFIVFRNI